MNYKYKSTSIKNKILFPMGSLYLLLIVFFFASIYFLDLKKQEKTSISLLDNIEQAFLRKIDAKAVQQAILMHIMEQNECVQRALATLNRFELSSCISSLYYVIEDTLLVSDINIIKPDGQYFFRFGKSLKNNEKPEGFVITRAINTHSLSYGLEISKENKITMIVARSIVMPSGKRFFIEIKTHISDILDALETAEDISLLVLAEKKYLKLRLKGNDLLLAAELGDYQLIYGNSTSLSQLVESTYGKHSENEVPVTTRYKFDDNYYSSGKFSLTDEGGRYFGHMIFIKNETKNVRSLYKSYFYQLLVILLISIFLYLLVNHYLNLIEKQLDSSYQALNNEIEERKSAEYQTRDQQLFLQSIIDGIDDNIMVIGTDYRVELMNNTAKKSLAAKFISDPLHPKCYEISHHSSSPCDSKEHPCPLNDVIKKQQSCKVIHNHPHTDGSDRFFELVATPLFNSQGDVYAVVESGRDLTEHLSVQNELRQQKSILSFQATHDALTGLPNRVLFLDRLEQSIKKAERYKKKIAVLFIDLDRFKEINDSLGHSVGDLVLVEVANQLKKAVRDFDTIARLGGDEFTIVMENIQVEDVNLIASKILQRLQKKMLLNERELYVTSSIGISIYPHDGSNVEALLKNADAAMYKAKDNGKNNYQFYTSDMTEKALDRVLMEASLRQALENQEFIVYYQPQVDALDGKIIGMEALVRWMHPDAGMIPPNDFIPLAVETGLINLLDEWVLKTTCKNLVRWYAAGLNPGRAAINLSVRELYQKDFLQRVQEILQTTQCLPQWIELEITEDYLMKDPEKSAQILSQIRDIGIQLAIDDFGTGYSSLAYLKRLPINKLKIDQSFIRDIPDNSDDKAITRTVISLAKNMNLDILAEGVETIQQRDFLQQHGCNKIQGYLYAKPMPADEIENLLKQGNIVVSDDKNKS